MWNLADTLLCRNLRHTHAQVLYLEGGIRTVEIGSVMFGSNATKELVRLAFPRRVYTQSHIDYVAEVVLYINSIKERIRGVKIVEAPSVLRHFSAHFEPAHGALIVDEET